MKITKVSIRRFKRFENTEFEIPNDTIVFAGPNNTGKTTLLQAIATWALAVENWLELGDCNARNNGYVKAPLARQAFYSVPLRNFNLLWHGGKPNKKDSIQIKVFFGDIFCSMEIVYDTTEQVYVRPVYENHPGHKRLIREINTYRNALVPKIVYVPAMTGITMEEPLYQPAKVRELLGQGRPGEVLRNLLVDVYESDENAWRNLSDTIFQLFRYEILPPQTSGANIIAEYRNNDMKLDIASAGSGFLQVLMLLTFLSANKESLLLLDEPDAHLHILLQDKIFSVLKDFASKSNSTLMLATHSERIINTVEPCDLYVVLNDKPKPIANTQEHAALITSLTALENADIMLAQNAKGILYVEGHTDISLLRAWADVLNHRLYDFLDSPLWKPTVYQTTDTSNGISSEKHYDAMRLAADIRGLELHDSDGYDRKDKQLKNELKRLFWRRYEIESYLIHPESIARFAGKLGEKGSEEKARDYLKNELPPAVFKNPLEKHDYLHKAQAKKLIDRTMQEAGIYNFKNFPHIAEQMDEEEIHPEVTEKLDAIADHFGIPKK